MKGCGNAVLAWPQLSGTSTTTSCPSTLSVASDPTQPAVRSHQGHCSELLERAEQSFQLQSYY
jgi:hypothetical protein